MATRYWVGGTGTWDATSTTHWASSSGGAGGASAPTSADDVKLDGNSGTGTITVSGTPPFKTLDATGYTGALTGSGTLYAFGSVTIPGTVAQPPSLPSLRFFASGTLASARSFGGGVTIAGSGITVTLGADLIVSTSVTLLQGTLNANGYAVTGTFLTSGSLARTLTLGASTWRAGGWNVTGSNFTLNAGTSKIILTGNAISGGSFYGAGLSYYDLQISAIATQYSASLRDSSSFHNLTFDPSNTVAIQAGSVQTVSGSLIADGGSSSGLITLKSTVFGTAFTISKASGSVTGNWLALQDSTATGGATFTATNAIDGGGNSGWTITPPPQPPNRMFLVFLSLLLGLLFTGAAPPALGPFARRRIDMRPVRAVLRTSRQVRRFRRAA